MKEQKPFLGSAHVFYYPETPFYTHIQRDGYSAPVGKARPIKGRPVVKKGRNRR